MNAPNPSRRRFTRAEIAVVAVILTLLALILTPVIQRARRNAELQIEKGRQATCIGNQRSLIISLNMYAHDCEENYPIFPISGSASWTLTGYTSFRNDSSFDCPNNAHSGTVKMPDYGINGPMCYIKSAGHAMASSTSLGDIFDISHYPVTADISPTDPRTGAPRKTYRIEDWNIDLEPRHSGGVIICFVDGNSKWIDISNIKPGNNILNTLFSLGMDPYQTGSKLLEKHGKTLSASPGNESEFAYPLLESLAPGASFGIMIRSLNSADWSAVDEFSVVLSDGKRDVLTLSIDPHEFNVSAGSSPWGTIAHGGLSPKHESRFRVCVLRGYDGRYTAYAYINEVRSRIICMDPRPVSALPKMKTVSLRLRGALGAKSPARVSTGKIHVLRYEIP